METESGGEEMEEEEEERAMGGKTEDMREEVWVVCMCHKREKKKRP